MLTRGDGQRRLEHGMSKLQVSQLSTYSSAEQLFLHESRSELLYQRRDSLNIVNSNPPEYTPI
jgi:hypothetical protein